MGSLEEQQHRVKGCVCATDREKVRDHERTRVREERGIDRETVRVEREERDGGRERMGERKEGTDTDRYTACSVAAVSDVDDDEEDGVIVVDADDARGLRVSARPDSAPAADDSRPWPRAA
ncbi:hypothetical protein ElyMa_001245400 [Elysia marginata]|uniref:Uncharacterized protein n=1 Tax=Elysia marginata TaxID=1093978 RepID=A0AAV4I9Z6_9GAST|nr:hypothetical protein ElyMa_001245400 [Elysia marginata]